MKNVEYEIKGKIMTIKIDITQSFGASKSGKSEIIASTEGNKKITVEGSDIYLGLNLYKKLDKPKEAPTEE